MEDLIKSEYLIVRHMGYILIAISLLFITFGLAIFSSIISIYYLIFELDSSSFTFVWKQLYFTLVKLWFKD